MANQKISDLAASTSVSSNDQTVIVQDGVTKRMPVSQLPVSAATQTELNKKATSSQGFTVVTTTNSAYPSTRPAGSGRVWFDDPSVSPPAWAIDRDRWASA